MKMVPITGVLIAFAHVTPGATSSAAIMVAKAVVRMLKRNMMLLLVSVIP